MFCCILLEIYVFSFPFNFPQVVFNSYFLSDVSIVHFWNYPFSRRNIGTNREKSSVFCFLVISYGILLTSRSQNTRSIRLSAASFSFEVRAGKKKLLKTYWCHGPLYSAVLVWFCFSIECVVSANQIGFPWYYPETITYFESKSRMSGSCT